MGTLEQPPVFEQLLGRVPSARERERLLRLQKALDLRDDDPMWAVAVILQDYDAAMREELERVHEVMKASRVEVARNNHLIRELAAKVSFPSQPPTPARQLRGWMMTAGGMCLVVFASLCITVGYTLGSGDVPAWLGTEESRGARVASVILKAPAGWLLLVPLLGVSGYLAHEAWTMMRERTGGLRARVGAWGLAFLAASSVVVVGGVLVGLL
ncbi:hypothetical protein FJV41_31345 [Myxococcus llanfairpwllgwyngyllgogerychwyrndrobwllllantysiliogogogochensis]|uniref:Uncharacterized protein n=1 Tax=Myxococcus llanfairpwllgwyngyllgogerychwyrndrobwllllantysiliogogogochensis TaxID=2590453 RepID=A0A540WSN1_9BACT|nr:hypothetical protein [Myxococcus llanfairpwllgwyngyllgogerychwyrndrobwllllantysiliogogogochensis]TQF12022.1 hypothetical protein FJV41_31345 [Myxococcus llanfairpwllgwyngyllgogerychwyrndrobwllllantysiliogogogochensis]